MDLETTGLDTDECTILEVGWVVTALDCVPIASVIQNVYPWSNAPDTFLYHEQADDFVRQMHNASGLWEARRRADDIGLIVSAKEIQRRVLYDAREHLAEGGAVTLAGSGVSTFDLPLIRRDYPDIAGLVTYYTIDVSVVERYFQLRTGTIRGSSKSAIHRVVPDIENSLRVARTINDKVPMTLVSQVMEALGHE